MHTESLVEIKNKPIFYIFTQRDNEPTWLHSWCVDSKSYDSGRFRFTGSYLWRTPLPRLVPPGLHCAKAEARALPGCHGDRSVLVNDRVHVEHHSRCRVIEFAQEASLCSPPTATSSKLLAFMVFLSNIVFWDNGTCLVVWDKFLVLYNMTAQGP